VPLKKRDGKQMELAEFESRLVQAGEYAVKVAREHVVQALPEEVLFRVYPVAWDTEKVYDAGETVFPNESLPWGKFLGPWGAEEAAVYLCRDGKVPVWIDAAVEAEDGTHSIVGLRCCGRFTTSEDLLYHRQRGLPPFAIKSPPLPPKWESVEASGRFDLYWRTIAKIEQAFRSLVGLSLWSVGRAATLTWFQFGGPKMVSDGRGGMKEVGEYALHTESAWRIYGVAGELLASDESSDHALARVCELSLVCEGTSSSSGGAIDLRFLEGQHLVVDRGDPDALEYWRLFRPETDGPHFVVGPHGIDE